MSEILETKKVRHFYQGENLVRPVVVELVKLDDDDESEMAFELTILHPDTCVTSRGQQSDQFPEVFRFQLEESARAHFDAYVAALDNVEESAEEIETRSAQARVNPPRKHQLLRPGTRKKK